MKSKGHWHFHEEYFAIRSSPHLKGICLPKSKTISFVQNLTFYYKTTLQNKGIDTIARLFKPIRIAGTALKLPQMKPSILMNPNALICWIR